MKTFKRLAALLLSITLIVISTLISVGAVQNQYTFAGSGSAKEKAELFKNPNGRIMSVARKGDWHSFPENSLEAIVSAAEKGADIIEIDIKKTKDNVFILLEDETLERTCNNAASLPHVAELSYDEISTYKLLEKQGGSIAKPTQYRVPTLAEALFQNTGALLLLDFKWEQRDELYSFVKQANMLDQVIFLTRSSAKEAAAWLNSLDEKPMTLGYHKGNVIFLATSYIDNYLNSGGNAVWLATNNPYGMNFQNAVLNNFAAKGRAVASPATPEICGQKTDNEIWWNDLVNRGFSIIITDYPAELSSYIDKSCKAMEKLGELNSDISQHFILPDFSADVFTEYKRTYTKALEKAASLLDRGFAGEQALHEAYYALRSAADNIELNYLQLQNGKSGLTITPIRVIIALIAAAAVIYAQLYTHKKMKKQS